MGASNFGRLDLADKYYVFGETTEQEYVVCPHCEEHVYKDEVIDEGTFECPRCNEGDIDRPTEYLTEWVSPERWEIEEQLQFFCEIFKERGAVSTDTNKWDNIATFSSKSKEYAGVDISMYFEVYIESGYHDGARLDFKAYFEEPYNTNEMTYEDIEDRISDHLNYLSLCTDKVKALRTKQATKWAEKEFKRMVKLINKALEEVVPTKLVKVGSFSSGETIYKRV